MQSGKKFEEIFFDNFMPDQFFGRGFRKATTKEDREEGTDFFCDGMRFDLTEDFSFKWKSHVVCRQEMILPWTIISLGIRMGNSNHEFEEPVIMIGVIAYSYSSAVTAAIDISQCWSAISAEAKKILKGER